MVVTALVVLSVILERSVASTLAHSLI